jgi:hypothetical protein
MHLNTDELVDIAEGTRTEASAPHLGVCEPCRARLHELRAMLSAARDVHVPEPSPLFWDHLSSRVSDAVAAEGAPRSAWLDVTAWHRLLTPAWAVTASLVVIVALSSRLMAPQPPAATLNGSPYTAAPPPPPPLAAVIANTSTGTDVLGDAASDDASLMLVASLTSALDLDAASDAGLAPSGSAEHAVTHMSDSELRELGRLLKEELARSGA